MAFSFITNLLTCSSLILLSYGQQIVTTTNSTTNTPNIESAIKEVIDVGSRSLEPWLQSLSGLTKNIPGSKPSGEVVGTFMNMIIPTPATTTTTETPTHDSPGYPHASRANYFAQSIGIPNSDRQNEFLQTPMNMVGSLATPFNVSRNSELVDEFSKVGEKTTKVFGKISGMSLSAPPESELLYYEYAPSDEWEGFRRPKYFSKECNFRVACEVGRLMKPWISPVSKQLKTNKVVQDLQSRYSRAFTYGTLYDNCEKYYCVILQLFGGPNKFVAAVAEIVNKVADPEPVEKETTL